MLLMGLQGHTGSGQPRRGCPLALLVVGALTEAWPRAVWMVQPPAETAREGDWKQVFLSGHVGLEGC